MTKIFDKNKTVFRLMHKIFLKCTFLKVRVLLNSKKYIPHFSKYKAIKEYKRLGLKQEFDFQ